MDSPTYDLNSVASNQYLQLDRQNGHGKSPYLHLSSVPSGGSLSSSASHQRRDSSPEFVENPSYAPYKVNFLNDKFWRETRDDLQQMDPLPPNGNRPPPTVARNMRPPEPPVIPPRAPGLYSTLHS